MDALLAFGRFLKRPWGAAILGFLSIYIVWITPAILFDWNEWSSFAYIYGDHLILPLFNALAFWLMAKSNWKIPWQLILGVSILAVLLVIFFEPDASSFREAGSISSVLRAYHSAFISLEFSFIILMCCVYPLLPCVHAPWPHVLALILLIEGFLMFVFIPDDWLHGFPFWEKAVTSGLLASSFIVFLINRKFKIIEKISGRLSGGKKTG